jgi:hypothetical protein
MLSGGLYCVLAVQSSVINRRLWEGARRLPSTLAHRRFARRHRRRLHLRGALQNADGPRTSLVWVEGALAANSKALHEALKPPMTPPFARPYPPKAEGRREGKQRCASVTGHAAELAASGAGLPLRDKSPSRVHVNGIVNRRCQAM